MFEAVPAWGAQGQLKRARQMPDEQADRHRDPPDNRMRQSLANALKKWPREKRANTVMCEFPREPTEQWNQRGTQQDERRCNHHQQQVLHHVRR